MQHIQVFIKRPRNVKPPNFLCRCVWSSLPGSEPKGTHYSPGGSGADPDYKCPYWSSTVRIVCSCFLIVLHILLFEDDASRLSLDALKFLWLVPIFPFSRQVLWSLNRGLWRCRGLPTFDLLYWTEKLPRPIYKIHSWPHFRAQNYNGYMKLCAGKIGRRSIEFWWR